MTEQTEPKPAHPLVVAIASERMQSAWGGTIKLADLTDEGANGVYAAAREDLRVEVAKRLRLDYLESYVGERLKVGMFEVADGMRYALSMVQLAPIDPDAPEPDIDAMFREISTLQSAVTDLAMAIVRTVEYVGVETLPALDGWSWFDALKQHRPALAEQFLPKSETPVHTRHAIQQEVWRQSCLEGDCDHRDEDGQPEDMSVCPPIPTDVCIDCMVANGLPEDPAQWEDAPLIEWPCEFADTTTAPNGEVSVDE